MTARQASRPRRYPLSRSDLLGGLVLYLLGGLSLLLLVGPSLIVVAISFTEKQYISFPPEGFTFHWFAKFWANQQLVDSLLVSLKIALWVSVVTLALGLPAAFSLVRGRYRGRTALSAFMVAPQMMPGMVIGIAVLFFSSLFAFYQSDRLLIVALAVFCLPFVVRVVMARLAGIDPSFEEASANLGASRSQTFLRVTLPQIAPGVLAATAFVFIEAFDNITVALFTSSPRGRPLSVELYTLVQFDSSPMVAAISTLEIFLALAIVLVIARTIGLDKIRG
jgi:putative spermidine/putrescine transport system permease protein